MQQREEIVRMLASLDRADLAMFGPKSEEVIYKETIADITREECIKKIKEEMRVSKDELSNLSNIHPAWIAKALENETPKVIGIILRWLPSQHVRYILENIPKRLKMALPKMVESFSVPTEIVALIKSGFERKFKLPTFDIKKDFGGFNEVINLSTDQIYKLLRDLGVHELAMAFHNVEADGISVLFNRMDFNTARSLGQRIKDVSESADVLKDAKYTILETAMDQEDIEKLLIEVGLAAFAKSITDISMFEPLKLKLDPALSYLFKRYLDQYGGNARTAEKRQAIVLSRISLLSKAGSFTI